MSGGRWQKERRRLAGALEVRQGPSSDDAGTGSALEGWPSRLRRRRIQERVWASLSSATLCV